MNLDDIVKSQFRIPSELYEQIRNSAAHGDRSINAEVVRRLARSFQGPEVGDAEAKERMQAFVEQSMKTLNTLTHSNDALRQENASLQAELRRLREQTGR